MSKSKNRYFYHILVSPGECPGAITLNVVRMEREFDAYKLSRFAAYAHLTITVSEMERDIGRKSSIFSYPLAFDAPVRGVPVGITPRYEKTRMAWLPHGEKISKISLFVLAQLTNVTDIQTDGHRMPAIAALCIASHGKN